MAVVLPLLHCLSNSDGGMVKASITSEYMHINGANVTCEIGIFIDELSIPKGQ